MKGYIPVDVMCTNLEKIFSFFKPNYRAHQVDTECIKGIGSRSFTVISEEGIYKDKHFATNFMRIG